MGQGQLMVLLDIFGVFFLLVCVLVHSLASAQSIFVSYKKDLKVNLLGVRGVLKFSFCFQ